MSTMRVLKGWGVAVLLLGAVAAWGEDGFVMHARMSFDAGAAMIKGKDDSDWSHSPVNTLVLPGDTLWIDKGGNAELEFSGGSFLRLADGSKAEIAALPPGGRVKAWVGSFYVHRLDRSSGDFVLETPSCSVAVAESSSVRVDILENGSATISVWWGQASTTTDNGGSAPLAGGQRCWVDPGLLPSQVVSFDVNARDDFDVWNRDRIEVLMGGMRTAPRITTAKPVDTTIIGYSELARCGDWVEVESRSYWRPTVIRAFVPFRHGHWSFVAGVGHTWVDEYPFGYVTSHYGRWHYFPSCGWVWDYDPVWSPAWVATVRCADYYVWAPIGYDCRPVTVRDSVFFSVGSVQFGLSCTSYVPVTHIYDGPIYVETCTPSVVTYVERHHADINVWNIYAGTRDPIRVPFDAAIAGRVRNYDPQRRIRGPLRAGVAEPEARVRVVRLENSVSRHDFRGFKGTEAPMDRAGVQRGGDLPRARTVSLRSTSATGGIGPDRIKPEPLRNARVPSDVGARGAEKPGRTEAPSRRIFEPQRSPEKPASPRVTTVDMDRRPAPPVVRRTAPSEPDGTGPGVTRESREPRVIRGTSGSSGRAPMESGPREEPRIVRETPAQRPEPRIVRETPSQPMEPRVTKPSTFERGEPRIVRETPPQHSEPRSSGGYDSPRSAPVRERSPEAYSPPSVRSLPPVQAESRPRAAQPDLAPMPTPRVQESPRMREAPSVRVPEHSRNADSPRNAGRSSSDNSRSVRGRN